MTEKPTYEQLEQRVRELEKVELEYKREKRELLEEKTFANNLVDTAQIIVLVIDNKEGRHVGLPLQELWWNGSSQSAFYALPGKCITNPYIINQPAE